MDEKTKNMMPAKNEEDSIEKEVEYCERLLKTIEGMPVVPNLPRIIEKMNLLKETMEDTKEEMYKSASVKPDPDRPLFLVETRSPDIEVLAVVV